MKLELKLKAYPQQYDFIHCQDTYSAFVGGRGGGKTHGLAIKALLFCLEHKGCHGLVTAPDYNRLTGSTIPKIIEVFGDVVAKPGLNKGDMTLKTVTGNHIYFRSTTDPDTLRGYSVAFVAMDEASFSPYESFEVLVATRRELPDGNLLWIATTPNRSNPLNWVWATFDTDRPGYRRFSARTDDNPYTSDEFKSTLRRSYSADLAMIELDGLFVPIAGNCFFDTPTLRSMIELDTIKPLTSERNDCIRTYKPRGVGKRYVAGIDTAEGRQAGDIEGGAGNPDFNCLRILDFQTGEDVAEIHCRWPMDEFLEAAVKLLELYANPFCGIEINYNRAAARKMIDLGYPKSNLYHLDPQEAGWLTTSKTRMPMLTEYEEAVRSRSLVMRSEQCVMEHLSFIRDKTGRPGAAHNAHDDYVIAGAIAWQMRKHARFRSGVPVRPTSFISQYSNPARPLVRA